MHQPNNTNRHLNLTHIFLINQNVNLRSQPLYNILYKRTYPITYLYSIYIKNFVTSALSTQIV